MKLFLVSLVAACALIMALAGSAFAVQPTTPRASEYIEVHCLPVGEPDTLFNRPALAAFDGQTVAQANYSLHHEEQCFVVVP